MDNNPENVLKTQPWTFLRFFFYRFYRFFRSKMYHHERCKSIWRQHSRSSSLGHFYRQNQLRLQEGLFCFVFVLAIPHGFPITIRPVALETLKMSDNGSLSTVVFLYTYNTHKIAILRIHFPFYLIKKSHFFSTLHFIFFTI